MRTFLLTIVMIILLSCTAPKWVNIGANTKMMIEYDRVITQVQLDSICKADTLSEDLNKWQTTYLQDYETKEKIVRYMYIKRMDSLETIYIATPIGDKYNVIKRATKK